jgi:hypothetical protein
MSKAVSAHPESGQNTEFSDDEFGGWDVKPKALANPDPRADAAALVAQVMSFVISCPAQYEEAGEKAKELKRWQKEIELWFEPMLTSTRAAYEQVLAQKKKELEPLKNAEAQIKNAIAKYAIEEQRRKQEEYERALKAHHQERQDFEKHKHEVIQQLQAEGKYEEVKEVRGVFLEQDIPVQEAAQKTAGVSIRKTWRAEVIDSLALVQAATNIPDNYLHYLIPNQKELDAIARVRKGNGAIPGVRFVSSDSVGVRA